MSEPRQPADDHVDQSQEAVRHQAEVYHCQTGARQQPSSSSQVRVSILSYSSLSLSGKQKEITHMYLLHQMVLLRNASRRSGRREASGSSEASDGAAGASEGGGGPQYRSSDVLSRCGGGGQAQNVHRTLQTGENKIMVVCQYLSSVIPNVCDGNCFLVCSQWANALVKDGKNLYEAEKAKRETFGKLFSKFFLLSMSALEIDMYV